MLNRICASDEADIQVDHQDRNLEDEISQELQPRLGSVSCQGRARARA